jgi:hypothetical protein
MLEVKVVQCFSCMLYVDSETVLVACLAGLYKIISSELKYLLLGGYWR